MPNNVLIIPIVNPVDLYDQDRALLPQYNNKYQEDWLFTETLRPWQIPGRRYYTQKWQASDVISFQVLSNVNPLNLYLVDQSGGRRRQLTFTQKQADRSGSGLFIYEASLALTGVADGLYKLILTVGVPVIKTLESDWQEIRAQHAGTLLSEYQNTDPAQMYGEAFFGTGWSPSFRFEGYWKLKQPYSQDTVYVDQVYNQRLQMSEPYDVDALFVGPSAGVPDWVVKKLNWIMGCDTVYYDGQQYTKGDGTQGAASKWEEISLDPLYAFRGWTIDLYPAKRRGARSFDLDAVMTSKKILVSLNVDTAGFADTTQGTASNVITITSVE